MPLKRTPPSTCGTPVAATSLKPVLAPAIIVPQDDSETNLTSEQEYETDRSSGNTKTRQVRRKKPTMEDEFAAFRTEFQKAFSNFKKEQNGKYLVLQNTIEERSGCIQTSVDYMSQKYDEMLAKIDSLKKEIVHKDKYIGALESRIDTLEKNSKAATIEMRSVPKTDGETKEDLITLVKQAGSILGVPLESSDVRDLFRVNSKSESKPIIVEFSSVLIKEKIVKSTKQFNKENKTNKLNTSHLCLGGPPKPIFISESLTTKAKRLYYLARDFAKEHNYEFVWTSYGRIYLRKAEGTPQHRIDKEDDFLKLKLTR